MMIPSIVKSVRILLRESARTAMRAISLNRMVHLRRPVRRGRQPNALGQIRSGLWRAANISEMRTLYCACLEEVEQISLADRSHRAFTSQLADHLHFGNNPVDNRP